MTSRRRETKDGEIQIFAGLVKCSNCGSSLNVSKTGGGVYKNFSCWVYKNYGKERCSSHSIGWKTFGLLVLEDIRRNACVASKAAQKYIDMLTTAKSDKQKKEIENYKREIKIVTKRIDELDKIISKLYEDSALGKITDERYVIMSGNYEHEQAELKRKYTRLTETIEKADEAFSNVENFVNLISRYTDIQELDTKILNELIEKIVVFEKTVNPDGSKSQRVDIYYKFIGYIEPEKWLTITKSKILEKNTA